MVIHSLSSQVEPLKWLLIFWFENFFCRVLSQACQVIYVQLWQVFQLPLCTVSDQMQRTTKITCQTLLLPPAVLLALNLVLTMDLLVSMGVIMKIACRMIGDWHWTPQLFGYKFYTYDMLFVFTWWSSRWVGSYVVDRHVIDLNDQYQLMLKSSFSLYFLWYIKIQTKNWISWSIYEIVD